MKEIATYGTYYGECGNQAASNELKSKKIGRRFVVEVGIEAKVEIYVNSAYFTLFIRRPLSPNFIKIWYYASYRQDYQIRQVWLLSTHWCAVCESGKNNPFRLSRL
jgi:hypothetical protein